MCCVAIHICRICVLMFDACVLHLTCALICRVFVFFFFFAPQIALSDKNELDLNLLLLFTEIKKRSFYLKFKQEDNYHSNFLITPGLHLLIIIQSTL